MAADQSISFLKADLEMLREDPAARSLSFFCKPRPPVVIGSAMIADLKRISAQRSKCNVRVCLHNDHSDLQHDMVILQHRRNYSRPHKHLEKGEVHHIMEGRVAIVLFDEKGAIASATSLRRGDIYRMGTHVYHLVLPLSGRVIFHESRLGPFQGDAETEYPAWAPDGADSLSTSAYLRKLRRMLAEHHGIPVR